MKLNWRITLLLFLVSGIFEVVVKGSNIIPITSIEPLIILALALSAISSSWSIVLMYIYISFLVDIINYQVVGLGGVSLFTVALLLNFINRFVDLASEHKFIFAMLNLFATLGVKMVLGYFFFQISLPLNLVPFIINIGIFVIIYLLINSYNRENVFKR